MYSSIEPPTFLSDEDILGPTSMAEQALYKDGKRYFGNWWKARSHDFDTANSWKLRDRAVLDKSDPEGFYVEVEPFAGYTAYRGIHRDRLLEINGKRHAITKQIPLYHLSQTRPCRVRERTKACIRFAKLYGFDYNRHIQEIRPGEWVTVTSDPDAPEYHQKRLFDLDKIKRHLNCKTVYGGFVTGPTRVVYLDIDFHEGRCKPTFLKVVKMTLKELPTLMADLDGYALHHQVANYDARGIHTGFILRKAKGVEDVERHVREWLVALDNKHVDLLQQAVQDRALGYMRADPRTHTFGKIEIFPNGHHGFRLPLCWDRTMLLNRPLTLLDNGKQDVVGFINYIETAPTPMAAEQVVAYLEARMAKVVVPSPHPEPQKKLKPASASPTKTPTSLKWKYQYRKNLIQFWCGTNCPKGSLDEVINAHARIAPHFRSKEEAKAILKEFLRSMPSQGWACSSRLLKQDFKNIDKNIDYAVDNAFKGNRNQREPDKSNAIWERAAESFRQISFDPFDKTTWHRGYTRYRVEVEWLDDDVIDFHRHLTPLFGTAQHVAPLDVINKTVGLVLTKEKEENGIALPYWRAFFEDQFGIACGDKAERRHQRIVQALKGLGIITVHQRPMFTRGKKGKGLATRYTTGRRVNERLGWKARLLTEEELLEEILGV